MIAFVHGTSTIYSLISLTERGAQGVEWREEELDSCSVERFTFAREMWEGILMPQVTS